MTSTSIHLLSDQKIGFVGKIAGFVSDAFFLERLRELGFVEGEKIKIHTRAPFKDPLIVEVRGAVVALRLKEAQCIQVTEN